MQAQFGGIFAPIDARMQLPSGGRAKEEKKKGGSSPFCMDHVPHRLSVAFGDLRAKGGSSLF